jgi:putative spermidine/putrescine transport system ATP-binding protein
VMLSESQFAARPFVVGEAVQLAWAPQAAHALKPTALA